MAYLKLGSTKINYATPERSWDRLILSQIPDTECSYNVPVLVRTVQELELYFGNSYSDFEYHSELLTEGATLLLYKPINSTPISNTQIEGWIDVDSYPIFKGNFTSLSDSSLPRQGTIGDLYYYYKVYENPGNYEDEDGSYNLYIWSKILNRYVLTENTGAYKVFTGSFEKVEELPEKGLVNDQKYQFLVVNSEGEFYYVYSDDLEDYIRVDQLPQNMLASDYLLSKYNRDSLRITDKDYSGPTYCHPKYTSRSYSPIYDEQPWIDSSEDKEDILETFTDYEGNPNYSMAYTFDFSGVTEIKENDYLVVPLRDSTREQIVLFWNPNPGAPCPLKDDVVPGASSPGGNRRISTSPSQPLEDKIAGFIEALESVCGWHKDPKSSGLKYTLWNNRGLTKDIQFFSIQGLTITQNLQTSHNILSCLTKDHARIEFFSKTIGPGDDDITLTIEKVKGYNPERYRFIIERYSYREVLEGNLYLDEDLDGVQENLERIVNTQSKLIECKIFRKRGTCRWNRKTEVTFRVPRLIVSSVADLPETGLYEGDLIKVSSTGFYYEWSRSSYTRSNPNDGLREGTWKLRRAIPEGSTPQMRYTALKEFTKLDKIVEDFLLIPKDSEWTEGHFVDRSWYPEYETLLQYSEVKNCQILITNSKDSFLYNKVEPDNRLVYFYESMSLNGLSRPGYYAFIRGILYQTYAKSIDDIIYESPELDAYSDDVVKDLEKYKSNYLSYNEHSYYYRKLFSHPGDWKYNLTIYSRYVQSHISKTVAREFPAYIGETYSEDMINGMTSILDKIRSENSIIQNLSLDYIEVDPIKQTLGVNLSVYIREAADKDVSLGVIINFNQS